MTNSKVVLGRDVGAVVRTVRLTEAETATYVEGSPEGDALRRSTRARALSLSVVHGCAQVEIVDSDGNVLAYVQADV